jgi:ABC-type sugar transport system ATPase subunit
MIKLLSISKSFRDKVVLRDLMFEIGKRETIALIGPNGCGKSTTLNIIAGLIRPDAGQVFVDEELVDGSEKKKRTILLPSERKLGYVFQSGALFPHLKISENIAYGLKEDNLSTEDIKVRVKELLEFVGIEECGNHYPRQLSGGQKQRAALDRSLARRPKILLLDEPLSAVDPQFKQPLQETFKKFLHDLEITSIYVTHDLTEAAFMAGKIAILGNGHIEQIGSPEEVRTNPKSKFVADFLGLKDISFDNNGE